MTYKEFVESLTAEQKAKYTAYVDKKLDEMYALGKQDGIREGLYRVRNLIEREFGL